MAGHMASMVPQGDPGLKKSAEIGRLIRTTLGPTLLGERVPLDFYARNGFRFLGASASLDSEPLAVLCQQFKNVMRLDPLRGRRNAIRTIGDDHLDADALLTAVARLESPRHRFVAELFWPHLPENEFELIRRAGSLAAPQVIEVFSRNGRRGLPHAHATHVQALAHHCAAIEAELAFLEGRVPAPERGWRAAIGAWRELSGSDEFWQYLRLRIEKADDPRLRAGDIDTARSELPLVILGPQVVFAENYAACGNYAECVRHLNFIMRSGFPDEVVRKVTWDAVKRVAGSKLGDLCQRAKKDFGDVKSKITRGAFEALAGPMLQEAQGIHEFLVEQLKVPAELMQHSAFDEFANSIRAATASKLDYDSSERERNILYSSLFVTRLLALPLSAAARRTIEQSIQEDNRYLYSLFGLQGTELPRSLDCFFLSGAQADADASIIITMYRIKERKVEVDRYRRSGGVRVSWETRRLLVPRSKEAKPAHGGTAAVKIPPSEYTSEQRAAAAKLKELEGKHLAKLMDLRTRRDSEVRSEESKLTAETAEHLQDAAFRAQTSVGELARLHEEQTGALAANSNEIAARKQAIEKRHAPLIAAAKDAETKRAERLSGLKGVMKVELPLTVLCTLLVSLLSQEARTTVLSADGVPLWVGAMFCAIVVGRFVRIAMDKRASPAEAAERARSHEILAANSEAEARAKQIQRHFTDSGKQAQAAVTSYNEQCSRARQDCNKKIEELAKQWSDRIDKAEKEHQRDVGDLMPLLVRKGSVRKVSDQTEFPAYQAARRKGFQPGEKPSDFEMQMTALERSQVMAMLMPRR